MKIGRTKDLHELIYNFRENIWDAQNKQFFLPIPIFSPFFCPLIFHKNELQLPKLKRRTIRFCIGRTQWEEIYTAPWKYPYPREIPYPSPLAILHMEQPSKDVRILVSRWNEFFLSCSFSFYSRAISKVVDENLRSEKGENFKLHGKQLKNRGKNRVNEEETRKVKNRRWGKRLTIF